MSSKTKKDVTDNHVLVRACNKEFDHETVTEDAMLVLSEKVSWISYGGMVLMNKRTFDLLVDKKLGFKREEQDEDLLLHGDIEECDYQDYPGYEVN